MLPSGASSELHSGLALLRSITLQHEKARKCILMLCLERETYTMVADQRKGARARARNRINAMLDDMVAASETPQTNIFAQNAICPDMEHMRWADDGGRHHD